MCIEGKEEEGEDLLARIYLPAFFANGMLNTQTNNTKIHRIPLKVTIAMAIKWLFRLHYKLFCFYFHRNWLRNRFSNAQKNG